MIPWPSTSLIWVQLQSLCNRNNQKTWNGFILIADPSCYSVYLLAWRTWLSVVGVWHPISDYMMRILRKFCCSVQVEKWKGLLERLRYSTTSNSIGDRSRDSFRLAIVGNKAFSPVLFSNIFRRSLTCWNMLYIPEYNCFKVCSHFGRFLKQHD